MSITRIVRVPEVGEVGTKATFRGSGTPVGTELRYYLAFAPVSSKLPTLETTTDRAKTRLEVDQSGAGYFTPDVPGHYQVECHDVTVTSTPQKWGGAPKVPDTDNDFAGAPVVDLSSGGGTARYGLGYLAVCDTQSRTIGSAPDLLTVAVKIHDYIETKANDAVVLTPSGSAAAKIAAFDDSVLGIRDILLDGWVAGNKSSGVSFASGKLQQKFPSELTVLRTGWNLHLGSDATWKIHNVADLTNAVTSTAVTTLAEAITRLTDIYAAYNAHRASATFHGAPHVADTTNIMPSYVAAPTDLVSAVLYARWLFVVMVYGFGGTTKEAVNPSLVTLTGHFIGTSHGSPGDPNGNYTFDFSSSLVGLLRATNELTRIYNEHRVRTTTAAGMHSDPDTENGFDLSEPPDMNGAALAEWANAWADSIERHTADVYKTATGEIVPLAPSVHQNANPIKIGKRASSLTSAIEVIELCCIAEELHALDGGGSDSAHFTAAFGFLGRSGPRPVLTRLQAHWRRATASGAPLVPTNFNEEPIGLLGLGWK